MQKLIDGNTETFVKENLSVFPAVAILGPSQCGKSTLVKMLYQNSDAYLYLDLHNLEDLNNWISNSRIATSSLADYVCTQSRATF